MDYHRAVLGAEVVSLLQPLDGKEIIDATLGNGGHSLLMLAAGARVVGIEADYKNANIAVKRIKDAGYGNKFRLIRGNFINIGKLPECKFDGILFDLGLSSNQLKEVGRGFSFDDDVSLDMRIDPSTQKLTAEEIINTWDFNELYEIFSKNAQERYSKPLILRIINERKKKPIKSGKRLGDIVRDFYSQRKLRSSIDPATKIFMALRIEVNQEFENLKSALKSSLKLIKSGGRVVIISFHSGEDRIVKQFIRSQAMARKIEVSKPESIRAQFDEVKSNPLSRSAVLRSFKIL